MATIESLDVSISVEQTVVHDLLREFAEKLYSHHGVQLTEVLFDWLDVSTQDKKNALLRDISIKSRTMGHNT